jgi:hypothetical protein
MPNPTPESNGRGLTLAALAEAKRLPVDFLVGLGLGDLPDSGVGILYFDRTGAEIAAKRRTALKAKEGSYWPRGRPLAAYGQWRLNDAEKAGFLILVEGESDCWAIWFHNLPALGIAGANASKTLVKEYVEAVETIYIHREPDQGGTTFVEGMVKQLAAIGFTGKVFELRMPDGIKDPADLHVADSDQFKPRMEAAIRTSTPLQLPLSHENDGRARQGAARLDGANPTVRPILTISTEEHVVNAAAVAALANDDSIYQRGGMLVRVVRDVSPAAKGIRRPFAPRIELLPPPLLRERLAANAQWVTIKETKNGTIEEPAHPPAWCVAAVHARADWPGIRHLEAVVDYPVLRPDGTILAQPGYDRETGLLLEMAKEFPPIGERPSRDDAIVARDVLLEVVEDFPFERQVYRAAWLAALLTPLARFAFNGPSPLFLVDANVRAAGKGLSLDTISRIVTGERFTIATYTDDEDELRKRITSLVLAGDRLVLFDNLAGSFGNAVLDAALTGTSWKDRVLGVNRMAEGPLYMTWYATGNNVAIAADTARRVCHIRFESPEEHPERRQDFRHPNLLVWVGQHRGRLLAAALTILRSYCAANRPDLGLPAWGSFEGWSGLVRSAVVWAGMPDPGETRLFLQEQADVAAESMGVLLQCWEQIDPDRRGLTAAEVIQMCKEPPIGLAGMSIELRDALEALLGKLDARALGTRLRSYRRRIFQGRFIDQAGKEHKAARWAVYPSNQFRKQAEDTPHTPHTPPAAGECGECGECVSDQPGTEKEFDSSWGPYFDGY